MPLVGRERTGAPAPPIAHVHYWVQWIVAIAMLWVGAEVIMDIREMPWRLAGLFAGPPAFLAVGAAWFDVREEYRRDELVSLPVDAARIRAGLCHTGWLALLLAASLGVGALRWRELVSPSEALRGLLLLSVISTAVTVYARWWLRRAAPRPHLTGEGPGRFDLSSMKQCPYCGEFLAIERRSCRWCGRKLDRDWHERMP